jgi:hypothetical protein
MKNKSQKKKIQSKSAKTKKKSTNIEVKPKLLGEGSYGCAFYPSFKCDKLPYPYNKKTSSFYKNKITKVMNHNSAIDEYMDLDYLHLDELGDNSFYIDKPIICAPPNKFKTPEDCKVIEQDKKPLFLLYDNGGVDLHTLLYYKIIDDKMVIIKGLKQIIKGALILSASQRVHLDIKLENIVTGVNKKGKGIPNFKLIDFGISKNYKNPEKYNTYYYNSYYIWSPHIIFISKPELSDSDINNYLDSFLHNIDNKTEFNELKTFYKDFYINYIETLKKDIFAIRNFIKARKDNWKIVLTYLIASSDLYSIGMLLLYVAERYKAFSQLIYNYLNKTEILSPKLFERTINRDNILVYYEELIKECEQTLQNNTLIGGGDYISETLPKSVNNINETPRDKLLGIINQSEFDFNLLNKNIKKNIKELRKFEQ